jgi:hypothetical protein
MPPDYRNDLGVSGKSRGVKRLIFRQSKQPDVVSTVWRVCYGLVHRVFHGNGGLLLPRKFADLLQRSSAFIPKA